MPLSPEQWKSITEQINNRKCCLLLGPEIPCIPVLPENVETPVLNRFAGFLKKKLQDGGHPVHETDEFYMLTKARLQSAYKDRRDDFEADIKEFRSTLGYVDLPFYRNLAYMPFNAVVNMSPDTLFVQHVRELGYDVVEEHYDFMIERKAENLSDERQIAYNLFGTLNQPKTVPVTDSEHFTLVKNLVAGKPDIAAAVRSRFSSSDKSFLFIGFDFDQWYYRLTIDSLRIPSANGFSYYSARKPIGKLSTQFYSEKINLQVMAEPPEQFVSELAKQYQARYGKFEDPIPVAIDFHGSDSAKVNELLRHLQQSGLKKRIKLDIREEGHDKDVIDKYVLGAKFLIAFISSSYLDDTDCLDRLIKKLSQRNRPGQPDQYVIAILADYANIPPVLELNALKILPRDETPLSAFDKPQLSKACVELASIINTMIR